MSIFEKTRATLFPLMGEPEQRNYAASVSGRLRRSTLVLLRWMAIAGQTAAIVLVAFGLGYDFPLFECFVVIGLSILLNLVVTFTLPLDRRVEDFEALLQLGFDLTQLAVLLWLTGGMNNPFALLFMAPVVTSATTLSRPVVFTLGALAASLSLYMVYNFQPLPWSDANFMLPFMFRMGAWSALIVGMTFTSLYAWRSARESRRMSEALRATETVLAQEQKLSALGGMAAAAAHELGTPLATIRLTAKELFREAEPGTHQAEDLELLLSQTERCREILKQLGKRGDAGDLYHDNLAYDILLEEVAEPYQGISANVSIDIALDGEGDPPVVQRRAELIYALKNLIENAESFARSEVVITGAWTDKTISLNIVDDGPGFDAAVRDRLGEPYVTARAEKKRAGGLGLGLFISKTLLERTGAKVRFANGNQGGAIVSIDWPIEAILGTST